MNYRISFFALPLTLPTLTKNALVASGAIFICMQVTRTSEVHA